MNRFKWLVVLMLGVFLSMGTSVALASPPGNGAGNANGNGNSENAPGLNQAPGPATPSSNGNGASMSNGAASEQGNSSPTTAGMKPAHNTAKATHCSTGGSGGTATCVSSGSNTQAATAKQDASKRYGNGETAAQIAVSRGAPNGTDIYGPGNSQPHMVTNCKHKHAVDVHAVKSYSSGACATSEPTRTSGQQQTVVTPARQAPGAQRPSDAKKPAAADEKGGVLGARVSIRSGKPARRSGGVLGATGPAAPALGAVARRGSLPFTGFPIWAAVLSGLALVAAGLTLRRRGRAIA